MMTDQPENLDNVAQFFKDAMEGQPMICAPPTTSAEWHGFAAVTMSDEHFVRIVNSIAYNDARLACDLVQKVHRRMPEKFVKRFFVYGNFIHAYCSAPHLIEPWMYQDAPIIRLAIMMLSAHLILDDDVRDALVAAHTDAHNKHGNLVREAEKQKKLYTFLTEQAKFVFPAVVCLIMIMLLTLFFVVVTQGTISLIADRIQDIDYQTKPVPQPQLSAIQLFVQAILRMFSLI